MSNGKSNKEVLARLDQRFSDFMEMYKEHRAADEKKFKTLETITTKVERMERPFKWIGGLVGVAAAGACTVIGEKAISWLMSAKSAAQHLSK